MLHLLKIDNVFGIVRPLKSLISCFCVILRSLLKCLALVFLSSLSFFLLFQSLVKQQERVLFSSGMSHWTIFRVLFPFLLFRFFPFFLIDETKIAMVMSSDSPGNSCTTLFVCVCVSNSLSWMTFTNYI